MKAPLVSIVIPLYNHAKYVREAIDSVLQQSYSDLELLVLNDGSTDNSEKVVQNIKDERLRYFSHPNQGAHYTLNEGLRLARGKYVGVLNSDDVYHKRRIETFVRLCEADRRLDACFSHIEVINEQGANVGQINGASHNVAGGAGHMSFRSVDQPILHLLGGNFLATTSNLFCRQSVLKRIGPFANYRYAHDYDFFLRLCEKGRVHIEPRHLLKYRDHSGNTIKESRAATHFEHALILAGLFSGETLTPLIRSKQDLYETMSRFLISTETFCAEKVLMILLLFLLQGRHDFTALQRELTTNLDNPFRRRCLDYLDRVRHGRAPQQSIAEAVRRLNRKRISQCSVYLFGTGEFSRIVHRHLEKRRLRPIGYFDNNVAAVGGSRNKLPIETPRLIEGIKVIIASGATRPIYRQLRQLGYQPRNILVVK